MPKTDYWAKRVLKNEEKAQKFAGQEVKRQQKLYRDTYKQIVQMLDSLAADLMAKQKWGHISRTELWQIKKFIDLQDTIGKLMEGIAGTQVSMTTETLRQIFEDAMEQVLGDIVPQENIAYSLLNKQQANQVLNTSWSGKHYSQRIYGTGSKIAERIKKDITDMVVLGKNPDQIKKQLMKDLDISYSYADRLVRTEASHVFNEAAKHAYKEAKVEEVEVLIENDNTTCPICRKNKGVYKMGQEPRLPAHANCRCCYAPVVKLFDEKEGNAV